jgi:hypothetical protein
MHLTRPDLNQIGFGHGSKTVPNSTCQKTVEKELLRATTTPDGICASFRMRREVARKKTCPHLQNQMSNRIT